MAPVIIGPRCNRRVTCDLSPSNDRSESSLAANPLDPYNMVGSSKRFTNPPTYAFSLAAYALTVANRGWRHRRLHSRRVGTERRTQRLLGIMRAMPISSHFRSSPGLTRRTSRARTSGSRYTSPVTVVELGAPRT
jgi:hypothetical protein